MTYHTLKKLNQFIFLLPRRLFFLSFLKRLQVRKEQTCPGHASEENGADWVSYPLPHLFSPHNRTLQSNCPVWPGEWNQQEHHQVAYQEIKRMQATSSVCLSPTRFQEACRKGRASHCHGSRGKGSRGGRGRTGLSVCPAAAGSSPAPCHRPAAMPPSAVPPPQHQQHSRGYFSGWQKEQSCSWSSQCTSPYQ